MMNVTTESPANRDRDRKAHRAHLAAMQGHAEATAMKRRMQVPGPPPAA